MVAHASKRGFVDKHISLMVDPLDTPDRALEHVLFPGKV